jgi:hypothetical protein
MDERKPAIPSSEFRLRSAPARTAADIDPPPAGSAASDELAAVERQRRSGQIPWYRGERRPPHDIFRWQAAFCRDRQEASRSPGKVGLWTRADSLTLFESLNIGSLELKN